MKLGVVAQTFNPSTQEAELKISLVYIVRPRLNLLLHPTPQTKENGEWWQPGLGEGRLGVGFDSFRDSVEEEEKF